MLRGSSVVPQSVVSNDRRRVRARTLLALIAVPVVCIAPAVPGGAQDTAAPTLEAVQAEIRALQQRLAREQGELDAGQQALRDHEREIAAGSRELAGIRADRDAQRAQAEQLRAEAATVRERLRDERQVLAQQLRMTYLAGRREMIKLVLSQQSPARLGRLLVYYDYLNGARSRQINAVTVDLEAQERLLAAGERADAQLAALEQAQSVELADLVSAREERRRVLTRIEQNIRGADSELQRLLDEQRRLTQVVAGVDALVTEFPTASGLNFADTRGRLAWPVQGALINDYGDSRVDGQLRWQGVMVGAPRGSTVRSVHQGRVVYADWLPGLGLLVIVDHGMGYMSLYGHNEAILTDSGVNVAAGEAIAQVGDSGGQRLSALYFEIREDGEPIDPGPWMNARLSP